MFVFVVAALVANLWHAAEAQSSEPGCSGVKYAFQGKGFENDVPSRAISGEPRRMTVPLSWYSPFSRDDSPRTQSETPVDVCVFRGVIIRMTTTVDCPSTTTVTCWLREPNGMRPIPANFLNGQPSFLILCNSVANVLYTALIEPCDPSRDS